MKHPTEVISVSDDTFVIRINVDWLNANPETLLNIITYWGNSVDYLDGSPKQDIEMIKIIPKGEQAQ